LNLSEVGYFALHRVIGSAVLGYYREMRRLENASRRELESLQSERLANLLAGAAKNVPYYRELASSRANLTLRDFPILTKSALKQHFLEIMTPELRREYTTGQKDRHYSWVKVQTGGTTGEPTTVIHDAPCRDSGRAGRLYSQTLCGFPLGTPYIKLWGSMRDINQAKESPAQRALRILHRETVLNAFRMSQKRIEEYIAMIEGSKVHHLMGYVDAIEELAAHAERKKLKVRPLRSIMACAGTVTPEARQVLENVFRARVHNQYGSRECAGIACECERGGHHIYSNRLLVEVVDNDGRPVPEGVSGRLLITLLQNTSFPIIRYEIGDVGALSTASCECGRPYPLLTRVEGRTAEFLIGTDGGHVPPTYIRHLIGVVHNPGLIRRFQLEQYSPLEFELRYEAEPDFPAETQREILGEIERDLKEVLGKDCSLKISHVDEITPNASGKFSYTKRTCGPSSSRSAAVVGV